MINKPSEEAAQELLEQSFRNHDGGTVKIMIDLQKQFSEVLEHCADADDQHKFNRHIFDTSELFGMMILSTVAVSLEGHERRKQVVDWIALNLLAGLESSIISALRYDYKGQPDALAARLDTMHVEAAHVICNTTWRAIIERILKDRKDKHNG